MKNRLNFLVNYSTRYLFSWSQSTFRNVQDIVQLSFYQEISSIQNFQGPIERNIWSGLSYPVKQTFLSETSDCICFSKVSVESLNLCEITRNSHLRCCFPLRSIVIVGNIHGLIFRISFPANKLRYFWETGATSQNQFLKNVLLL